MEITVLFIINTVIVSLAVIVHYEALFLLGKKIPSSAFTNRFRLLIGVFGILVAHVFEVALFAVAYHLFSANGTWGQLEGAYSGSFLDSMYFSFVSFSTVGCGDIQPVGDLRYLAGVEALSGLLLIAWSATFLFMLMEKQWVKSGSK